MECAENWPWSSVRAHHAGQDGALVKVAPLLDCYGDFTEFLAQEAEDEHVRRLRMSETTGRPVGSEQWLHSLGNEIGRVVLPQKRGPKRRNLD